MGHGAAHLASAERRQTYVTLPLLLKLNYSAIQYSRESNLWPVYGKSALCHYPSGPGGCVCFKSLYTEYTEKTVHCTLYNVHCKLYLEYTLYTLNCQLYTINCTL